MSHLISTKPTNVEVTSHKDVGIREECSDNPGYECLSMEECDNLYSNADVLFTEFGNSRINETW